MRLIDLHHLGHPQAIAVYRVGDVLVDCGPSSCLPRLVEAVEENPPRVLLLTHIHLDHAGAAGELVKRWPELIVYVHPVGSPHLEDPTRLVKSATRIYGGDMDRLWGPVTPVPNENIRVLEDGEVVEGFAVAYTPGHASHHVSFLDQRDGVAFAGDAAGVRIPPSDLIMPHAPPPDIDLEAWDASLDLIECWQPTSVALPHFGTFEDVNAHLERMRIRLHQKAELARIGDSEAFVRAAQEELATLDSETQRTVYMLDSPPDHMFAGLRRYWDRRGGE
jgi:glyoxylase-like metal-dependent hydrolase (beta-lactamase superfamily II)